MSYIDQRMGFSILPISSILKKPSVTQCRFTISAFEELICDAEIAEKRAGDLHVLVGED